MRKNKLTGSIGEAIAEQELVRQGYEIVMRNYRCSLGELDLVARHNNYLVFIEVKHRTSNKFGSPREAVGFAKQYAIRMVALAYLKQHKCLDAFSRFDVVEVLNGEVTIIENAF